MIFDFQPVFTFLSTAQLALSSWYFCVDQFFWAIKFWAVDHLPCKMKVLKSNGILENCNLFGDRIFQRLNEDNLKKYSAHILIFFCLSPFQFFRDIFQYFFPPLRRMSFGADVGWTVVFSLMIINAIIGNIVVFWIVLCKLSILNVSWITILCKCHS